MSVGILTILALPLVASADHMDVIEVALTEKCTIQEYVAIKDDFNEQWGKNNGYRAEVVVPIQSQNLVSIFWIGRSANAAAYGAAWDTWRDQLEDSNSVAAKLDERFQRCSDNVSRRGYDVY